MATLRFTNGANDVRVFTPISTALSNLPNGPGTIVAMVKRPVVGAAGSDYAGLMNPAGTNWYHTISTGLGGGGQKLGDDDGLIGPVQTTAGAQNDTTNWHFFAVSWPSGGAALERFHYNIVGGSWTHDNSATNNGGNRAGPGTTGWMRLGSCLDSFTDTFELGLVAVWNVQFADGDFGTWAKTSDLWNHANGRPIFLVEGTSLTPVDLTGGSTYSAANSTAAFLTLTGSDPTPWTFDQLGGNAPNSDSPLAGMLQRRALRRARALQILHSPPPVGNPSVMYPPQGSLVVSSTAPFLPGQATIKRGGVDVVVASTTTTAPFVLPTQQPQPPAPTVMMGQGTGTVTPTASVPPSIFVESMPAPSTVPGRVVMRGTDNAVQIGTPTQLARVITAPVVQSAVRAVLARGADQVVVASTTSTSPLVVSSFPVTGAAALTMLQGTGTIVTTASTTAPLVASAPGPLVVARTTILRGRDVLALSARPVVVRSITLPGYTGRVLTFAGRDGAPPVVIVELWGAPI